MDNLTLTIIFIAALLFAFGGYWIWRFNEDKMRGIPPEQIDYVADMRQNLANRFVAAFTSIIGNAEPNVRIENTGMNSTAVTCMINGCWMTCYFNWYNRKVRIEYFLSGNDTIWHLTMRYREDGSFNTTKMLKHISSHYTLATSQTVNGLQSLMDLKEETLKTLEETKQDFSLLLPAILEDYIINCTNLSDVAQLGALYSIICAEHPEFEEWCKAFLKNHRDTLDTSSADEQR